MTQNCNFILIFIVFSYLVHCFVHTENKCLADTAAKTSRKKRTRSNTWYFFPKGYRDTTAYTRKWKPSSDFGSFAHSSHGKWCKQDCTKKRLMQGRRGATAPGKTWTCLCLKMHSEGKNSPSYCGLWNMD